MVYVDLIQELRKEIAWIDEMKRQISSLISADERKKEITPQLFTAKEAAIYIGMSESWLAAARKKPAKELRKIEGEDYIPRPKHTQLSVRRIRYSRSTLDKWIQTQSGAEE